MATGEVAERLGEVPGVMEANVYGVEVPGAEGRAGMASLVVGPGFDVSALQAHADAVLPAYARPVFLRLQSHIETTGTLKYRKVDAVAEGFDPARVQDPLYVREPGADFRPVDAALHRAILSGAVRL